MSNHKYKIAIVFVDQYDSIWNITEKGYAESGDQRIIHEYLRWHGLTQDDVAIAYRRIPTGAKPTELFRELERVALNAAHSRGWPVKW